MPGDVPETVPAAVPDAPASPGLPELTPKDKKRLREEVRREFKAAERERMEKAAASKTGAAPSEKSAAPAASSAPEPEFTDPQLRENAAHFLRGVLFPFLALLALPFGYRLDLKKLTEAQARDDAAAWVPVLRLYGWLRAVVTWTAVPARLFARLRELAVKRERPEAGGQVVPLDERRGARS